MNNQELELRVKEILEKNNFFDMIEAVVAFEKEYKGTDFYKKTRIPLMEVIKNAKIWYLLQVENIGNKIQDILNNLSFDNVNDVINKLGDVYLKENEETLNILKQFQEIVK